MSARELVLLVEDEPYVRESTAEILSAEGLEVLPAADLAGALRLLAGHQVDVVLTDLRLSGESGLDLLGLPQVEGIPVVVITGAGTVDDAVAAMKAGAYDFVQKPVDPDRLALVVRRALDHGRLVDQVRRLRTSMDRLQGRRLLVGSSAAMQGVRALIEQVAATDATVLVTGESGTGKELVARELHRRSARAEGPLVPVNCAAVPEGLFESEFFGHRRGAFSGAVSDRAGHFAEAGGGTLVLDEIETLPPEFQAKLLRVLESGEYQRVGDSRTRVVDTRIVAVSNEDLAARVRRGDFRSDLYWRLHVFPIELPPLRAHPEDIPEIAGELLARIAEHVGIPLAEEALDASAQRALSAYPWPGNVRELRNVLERALILSTPRGVLGADLLAGILRSTASVSGPADGADAQLGLDLRARLEALERRLIDQALASAGGRKKDAAELLGVDPKNLGYYLRKHGLRGEEVE